MNLNKSTFSTCVDIKNLKISPTQDLLEGAYYVAANYHIRWEALDALRKPLHVRSTSRTLVGQSTGLPRST